MPKRYLWLGGLMVGLTGLAGASQPSMPGLQNFAEWKALPPAALEKLAPNLRTHPVSSPQDESRSYIVQFQREADRPAILRGAGVTTVRNYAHLPMAAVEADDRGLRHLALNAGVRRISLDATVKRSMDTAIPTVGADLAHQKGWDGQGVGIAVIDSGIARHSDLGQDGVLLGRLRQRSVAGYDFIQNCADRNGNDACGHGTMIAGIAAGNATASTNFWSPLLKNTKSFYGVAPQANILNLRILDRHGVGTVHNAIAAIDWCIQNRSTYNIRVMNLSLGHPPYESYRTDPLCQAVEAAWKAGIVVVCAAGNRGRAVADSQNGGTAYGTINSPGNDPYVITVGALNDQNTRSRDDDWIASFSSRGPTVIDHIVKPDLVAPGNMVISLRHPGSELERVAGGTNLVSLSYYWNRNLSFNSPQYFHLSGTSMAAAVVTGAVALMLERDPTATPDTVKARLMITARKRWRADGKHPDVFSRGSGLLNVPLALRANFHVTAPALSPWAERVPRGIRLHMALSRTGETTWWAGSGVGASQALWTDDPYYDYPPPPPDDYAPPGEYPYPYDPYMPPPPAEPDPTEYPDYYPPPPDDYYPPPPDDYYPPPGEEPPPPGDYPPPPADDPYYYEDPYIPPPSDGTSGGPVAEWPDDPYNNPDDGQALWTDNTLWGDYAGSEQQAQSVWSNQAVWSDQLVVGAGGIVPNHAIWADQPGVLPGFSIWADIFRLCITGDR